MLKNNENELLEKTNTIFELNKEIKALKGTVKDKDLAIKEMEDSKN